MAISSVPVKWANMAISSRVRAVETTLPQRLPPGLHLQERRRDAPEAEPPRQRALRRRGILFEKPERRVRERGLHRRREKQQKMSLIIMEQTVPENHLLRKVDRAVDFSFIYELCAPLYCADNGRPAADPEILFRMLLVSRGWSPRRSSIPRRPSWVPALRQSPGWE